MTQERNVNKQCGKDNTTNATLNINVHITVKFRTGIFVLVFRRMVGQKWIGIVGNIYI